jgi:hypothetical protein
MSQDLRPNLGSSAISNKKVMGVPLHPMELLGFNGKGQALDCGSGFSWLNVVDPLSGDHKIMQPVH